MSKTAPQFERDAADVLDRQLAVSPRQAAQLLGVSVPTIYELLNSGRLPSVKVGARRLIATSQLRAIVEPAAGLDGAA